MAWLLAFSVQHEVEKYGAYLAIASFLGLALLSILYFAQAREVRRLREWAGRAPERDAELAARVTEQADAARRLQAQPIRRPAATDATQVVAPPAPVAEPATNGHPTAAPLTVPMGPRPATAAAAVAAAVGAATAAPEPDAPASEPEAPAAAPEPPTDGGDETPPPAKPNGNGNGTGDVAAIPRATPRPAPAPAPRRPAAQPARVPQRTATVPPRRVPPRAGRPAAAPAQPERSRTRGIVIGVVAGIVVIAVAALVITQLGGGGGGGTTLPNTTEPPTSSPTTSGTSSAGPSRAETEVVVLNGTTTEGQAAQAKTTLEQAGYATDHLPTANASNQATATSTVYYAPNRRRQAALVARALKITRISPVDSQTKSLADNSSDPPVTSDVVVILGSDRTP
jgi:LytR cell envelope-related transcriptional attenuator